MLNWIVKTSLNLRVVVVVLAVVLMIFGIQVVRTSPLDVFPEFAPPLVEIQTEAPGLSTAEVESLISVPIENSPDPPDIAVARRSGDMRPCI